MAVPINLPYGTPVFFMPFPKAITPQLAAIVREQNPSLVAGLTQDVDVVFVLVRSWLANIVDTGMRAQPEVAAARDARDAAVAAAEATYQAAVTAGADQAEWLKRQIGLFVVTPPPVTP